MLDSLFILVCFSANKGLDIIICLCKHLVLSFHVGITKFKTNMIPFSKALSITNPPLQHCGDSLQICSTWIKERILVCALADRKVTIWRCSFLPILPYQSSSAYLWRDYPSSPRGLVGPTFNNRRRHFRARKQSIRTKEGAGPMAVGKGGRANKTRSWFSPCSEGLWLGRGFINMCTHFNSP